MSGPRVTSGEDSKQDYGTQRELLDAVEQRFGPIAFDLAAHRANKKHARYFAPPVLVMPYGPDDSPMATIEALIAQGADTVEAHNAVEDIVVTKTVIKLALQNHDRDAVALDALVQDWEKHLAGGLGWLNCEFGDCGIWARKCMNEGQRGAETTLLTPAQIGSDWCRDNVCGHADIYFLNGRLCFDGVNPFPKDCMVSHYGPRSTGSMYLWDWRRDRIVNAWLSGRSTERPAQKELFG